MGIIPECSHPTAIAKLKHWQAGCPESNALAPTQLLQPALAFHIVQAVNVPNIENFLRQSGFEHV
jgi:hypothetical protein